MKGIPSVSNSLYPDQARHIVGPARADQGFLERGFMCIKVLGVRFADFISFFLIIP